MQLLELQAELAILFTEHHFYMKEKLVDKLGSIQTWVCGNHFIKNELSKPVTSSQMQVVINDKVSSEFWKTLQCLLQQNFTDS